jgi:[acyl-carrier-protein] S-malonyltransferase
MIAIVCPGQGAQSPGFFAPWLELEVFKQKIERLADASGVDLLKHGTVSDADTIRDTAIAQPLIVSAGIASAAVMFNSPSWPGSSSLALRDTRLERSLLPQSLACLAMKTQSSS